MRWLIGIILPVILIVGLLGCDELISPDENGEGDTNTPPVAVAGSDQDVDIGDTVNLDGSSSTDPDGDDLTYQWELVSSPDASSASIQNSTSETASFVADSRGSYTVRLTVSDGTDDDSDDLSVTAEIMVIGNVDSDITLTDVFDDPEEADYAVTNIANINAVLTIEPGVKIEFASGARMDIETTGALVAVGTESDSIVFTGVNQTSGFWDGINVISSNPDNEISYASITYGGSDGYANIYVDSEGSVEISHTRSDNSSTYGLESENGAELRDFSENSFNGNTLGALNIPANLIGSLDAQSSYAGTGGTSEIAVFGTAVATVQTWPAADAPFVMDGITDIEALVTIKPGAVFQFTSGSRMDVELDNGALVAVGKADSIIQFLGTLANPGHWDGIQFYTNNPNNELTYVEVSHGGADGYANVYMQSSAGVKITNSEFTVSDTYGLEAENGALLREFSSNTFEDDAQVLIPSNLIGSLDAQSSYMGTGGTGEIMVFGTTVTTEQTWPAADAPFVMNGITDIEALVTIKPGAVFQFTSGSRMDVELDNGALAAVGKADSIIQFLGTLANPGHWDGIQFYTNNPNNELTYVEVSHGGADGYANVDLKSSASVSITNSEFTMSATYGLDAESNALLNEFSSNTYEDDAIIRIPANLMGMMDAASTYLGTGGTGHIFVYDDEVTTDQSWAATDAPFRLDGIIDISSDVVVEAGAVVEFTTSSRLDVEVGGSLNANGTAGNIVYFQGTTDVKGHWDGIQLYTSLSNQFDYCEIANGGRDGYANIYIQSTSNATVNNSTIRDSDTYGVEVESGGSYTESGNTYSGNDDGDVFLH